MSISNRCRNGILKHTTYFHDKICEKVGTEGTCLNLLKVICHKLIGNITMKGAKLNPLKSVSKHRCLFSPLLFNIVFDFLARSKRQETVIKGIHIED
jgi:hypothetical protein